MARRVLIGADTSLKEIDEGTTAGHDGDLKTQWLTLRFDIAIVTSESAGGGGVAKAMKGGKRANSALNKEKQTVPSDNTGRGLVRETDGPWWTDGADLFPTLVSNMVYWNRRECPLRST